VIAVRVPTEYAGNAAAICWTLIVKACSRGGGLVPAELELSISLGTADLWLMGPAEAAPVAIGVTRFEEWQEGRVMRVLCVGGRDVRAWLEPFRAAHKAYAREMGAVLITWEGRLGWDRLLPDLKPKRYIYEEEIKQRDRGPLRVGAPDASKHEWGQPLAAALPTEANTTHEEIL
jgi:hypothetical protein